MIVVVVMLWVWWCCGCIGEGCVGVVVDFVGEWEGWCVWCYLGVGLLCCYGVILGGGFVVGRMFFGCGVCVGLGSICVWGGGWMVMLVVIVVFLVLWMWVVVERLWWEFVICWMWGYWVMVRFYVVFCVWMYVIR